MPGDKKYFSPGLHLVSNLWVCVGKTGKTNQQNLAKVLSSVCTPGSCLRKPSDELAHYTTCSSRQTGLRSGRDHQCVQESPQALVETRGLPAMRKGRRKQKGMGSTRCCKFVVPLPVSCFCGMPFAQVAEKQNNTGGAYKRQAEAPTMGKDKRGKVGKDQLNCHKCGKLAHFQRNCPQGA